MDCGAHSWDLMLTIRKIIEIIVEITVIAFLWVLTGILIDKDRTMVMKWKT